MPCAYTRQVRPGSHRLLSHARRYLFEVADGVEELVLGEEALFFLVGLPVCVRMLWLQGYIQKHIYAQRSIDPEIDM